MKTTRIEYAFAALTVSWDVAGAMIDNPDLWRESWRASSTWDKRRSKAAEHPAGFLPSEMKFRFEKPLNLSAEMLMA